MFFGLGHGLRYVKFSRYQPFRYLSNQSAHRNHTCQKTRLHHFNTLHIHTTCDKNISRDFVHSLFTCLADVRPANAEVIEDSAARRGDGGGDGVDDSSCRSPCVSPCSSCRWPCDSPCGLVGWRDSGGRVRVCIKVLGNGVEINAGDHQENVGHRCRLSYWLFGFIFGVILVSVRKGVKIIFRISQSQDQGPQTLARCRMGASCEMRISCLLILFASASMVSA